MVSVSEKLAEYLKGTGRHFKGKIKVGDTALSDGINEMTLFSVLSSEKMTIGNVNSSYIDISLYDCPNNISGCELEVFVGAEIENTDEYIRLGFFTAEKPKTVDGLTTLTAYDRAKSKTGGIYETNLSGAVAIDELFEDVCSQCGVGYVPLFSSETAQESKPKVDPTTFNGEERIAVLGQIAGFFGGNLICNRDGKLEVRKYSACTAEYDDDMCDVPEIEENIFNLQRLTCVCGEETLTAGSGDGVTFENRLMTQERLETLLEELKGMTYTPISCDILVGDPRMEVGDIVTLKSGVNTYAVPVMRCEISFDGGVSTKIESFAETGAEESTRRTESASEKISAAADYAKAAKKAHDSFLSTLKEGLEKGLYRTEKNNADGSSVIYYHDKPDIESSTYIQTFGAGGRAWVSGSGCWNGGSPVWKYGETKDGDAVLRDLLVRTLTADLIKAGKLSSFDGKTYFDLDNGEICTTDTGHTSDMAVELDLKAKYKSGGIVFEAYRKDSTLSDDLLYSLSILPSGIVLTRGYESEGLYWKIFEGTYTVKSKDGKCVTIVRPDGVLTTSQGETDSDITASYYQANGAKIGGDVEFLADGAYISLEAMYDALIEVGAKLLVGSVAENSDMNELTNQGRYDLESNAVALTCSNLPKAADSKPTAGYIEVMTLGETGYVLQRFTPYNNAGIFTRWYNQYRGTWGGWVKYSGTAAETYVKEET